MDLADRVLVIRGVGEEREKKLNRLGIVTIRDLIEYFPRDYKDRSKFTAICDLEPEEICTIKAYICGTPELMRVNNLLITKLKIGDETGECEICWFNQPYLKNYFKKNILYVFTGKIILKFNKKQLESPEYEVYNEQEMLNSGRIVPVYSSTEKLSQKTLRGIIKLALDEQKEFNEFIPQSILKKYSLCSRDYSIRNIHFPENDESFFKARHRLVFEELFMTQLALFRLKGFVKTKISFEIKETGLKPLIKKLPFELTDAQKNVLEELTADIKSGYRMNRLVQGDVGSGKTVIAMAAAYIIINNGMQAALMAPTEALARQHFQSISSYFGELGINSVLLSGAIGKKEKAAIYSDILSGTAKMIIGTHAIIQENVRFCNLGLVITDEQHRFGVRQRGFLSEKGDKPHQLVMSATPIPRTLGLILYGDLDISIINQNPPGRQRIETYAVNTSYRQRIYEFIKKQINMGRQAYIICPSIEQGDGPIESVTEYYTKISGVFGGYSVECLHGRLKQDLKQNIMERFILGEIDIIISTTVIEVGINVPNATVMLIENAERFGLAQLHQLRGRVGRGFEQSYCIMISDSKSKIYKQRMKAMTDSNDGFYISELDLRLRGHGDFFGTRQHGLPEMKIANLYQDIEILKQAQEAAQEIINTGNFEKELEIWFKENGNLGMY